MNNRRVILIISAVVGILLIGGILFFFLSQRATPTTTGTTPSIFGRLPIIGGRLGGTPTETVPAPTGGTTTPTAETARQLMQITDEPVIGPLFNPKTQKILYYKKNDGHLVANDPGGGAEETISNLTILNILDVRWSPDKNKAVVLYQDGDVVKKFLTEATSTPKVIFLPQDSMSPAWSTDGKSLWWLARQGQTYTLVSADANAKNQRQRTFSTPIPDLQLSLIGQDIAVLAPKTASIFETPLFLFNSKTQTLSTTLMQFGLMAIGDPNPKAQNILYTSTNRLGALQNLHLLDIKTPKDTSWPISTIATKCAFSFDSKEIFCAVPQNPPSRDLPEAWFQGKQSFSDTFYRIDIAAGKAEEIYNQGTYDAVSLVVSDDSKKLFFIDKKTGFLYSLALD